MFWQLLAIFNYLNNLFPYFTSTSFVYQLISPISFIVKASMYIHIIALALNRFHAVFFPFSYQHMEQR